MPAHELPALAARLFGAYGEGDLGTVQSLLADDLIAYVTNAEAGTDEVRGADEYMKRLPDLRPPAGVRP